MKPEDFKTFQYGRPEVDPDEGYCWFNPEELPSEGQLPLEPETLIALSRADAAVGKLDGIAQLLPNPHLIVSPYAAREAVASSRIEGTHATLTDVYEAEVGRARAYVEEAGTILAYRRALYRGLDAVRDGRLDIPLILEIHRILMHEPRRPVDIAGRWREQPVWLGSPTAGPETALFVPPRADKVDELMAGWERWHADRRRLPLLIRVALLHYQFLSIHPFLDGNGRVGRMLIQLMLEEEHALSAPLLYVSSYFAAHRTEYYERLQRVRFDGEIQEWLQFFLTAVHVQAEDGVKRARRLHELRERYRSDLSGSRSRAGDVVDLLFENPLVSTKRLQKSLGISAQGALKLLRGLEERGILFDIGAAGRGNARLWVAREILDLLEDEPEKTDLAGDRSDSSDEAVANTSTRPMD